jgi:regulator of nonsense transcripts 1
MHGWPYELRHSAKMNPSSLDSHDEEIEDTAALDFTKKFLVTASMARCSSAQEKPDRAPTLDEAAWSYFERHQDDCFDGLRNLLSRMDQGEVFSTGD